MRVVLGPWVCMNQWATRLQRSWLLRCGRLVWSSSQGLEPSLVGKTAAFFCTRKSTGWSPCALIFGLLIVMYNDNHIYMHIWHICIYTFWFCMCNYQIWHAANIIFRLLKQPFLPRKRMWNLLFNFWVDIFPRIGCVMHPAPIWAYIHNSISSTSIKYITVYYIIILYYIGIRTNRHCI